MSAAGGIASLIEGLSEGDAELKEPLCAERKLFSRACKSAAARQPLATNCWLLASRMPAECQLRASCSHCQPLASRSLAARQLLARYGNVFC